MALFNNLSASFQDNPVNRVSADGRPLIGGSNISNLTSRSLGSLAGVEVRGRPEQLTAALAQIDPNAPDAQEQQMKIIAQLGTVPQQMQAMQKIMADKQKIDEKSFAERQIDGYNSIATLARTDSENPDFLKTVSKISKDLRLDPTKVNELIKTNKKDSKKVVVADKSILVDSDTGEVIYENKPEPESQEEKSRGSKGGPAPYIKVETSDSRGNPVTQFLDPATLEVVKEVPRTGSPTTGNKIADLQKIVLTTANEQEKIKNRADKLVSDLQEMPETYLSGSFGRAEEMVRGFTGRQDVVTLLRVEATALRNSNAINNLPKGPASDKDVALVLAGELDPYANKETLLAYARGISKLAAHAEQNARDQSSWVSKHKGSLNGFSDWQQVRRYEKEFINLKDPVFLAEKGIPAEALRMIEENPDDKLLGMQFNETYKYDYAKALENNKRSKDLLEATGRNM